MLLFENKQTRSHVHAMGQKFTSPHVHDFSSSFFFHYHVPCDQIFSPEACNDFQTLWWFSVFPGAFNDSGTKYCQTVSDKMMEWTWKTSWLYIPSVCSCTVFSVLGWIIKRAQELGRHLQVHSVWGLNSIIHRAHSTLSSFTQSRAAMYYTDSSLL